MAIGKAIIKGEKREERIRPCAPRHIRPSVKKWAALVTPKYKRFENNPSFKNGPIESGLIQGGVTQGLNHFRYYSGLKSLESFFKRTV